MKKQVFVPTFLFSYITFNQSLYFITSNQQLQHLHIWMSLNTFYLYIRFIKLFIYFLLLSLVWYSGRVVVWKKRSIKYHSWYWNSIWWSSRWYANHRKLRNLQNRCSKAWIITKWCQHLLDKLAWEKEISIGSSFWS